MKTNVIIFTVAVTTLMTAPSVQVMAQGVGAPIDRLEAERRSQEERRRAEKAVTDLLTSQNAMQRNLEQLQSKKSQMQRDMSYFKSKYERAAKDMDLVSKMQPVDKDLLDSTQKDVTYYQTRLKVTEEGVSKLDSDIQETVKNLREAITAPTTSRIILPGEVLQLFVLEDESFNGLYQVRNGGYVVLPRVGRVSVVGKDLPDAEKSIKEKLEATQLKQGTVMLERSAGIYGEEIGDVIYLAGEFKTTGPLRTPQGVQPTIVTTILRAGGLSPAADLTRVKLLRLESGKSLVEEVNVQSILDGSGLQSDLSLSSGDILVVPAFAPVIYVTGNVKSPGVIRLSQEEDLTAYSAILRCGGFARFAKLGGVYVLRDRGNGEKSRIPVDINDLQSGKRADVVLQGKDIVVVPEKFFSF